MTRRSSLSLAAALLLGAALTQSACTDTVDALTSHVRPVASVAGEDLPVGELASIMADSNLPDTALTAHWATQIGRLWADYVSLVRLYQVPDTTLSLDYGPLLEGARYVPALLVQQYRDSVVLAGIEPTDTELREWYETTQPLTRLDVRRIRLGVPEGATEVVRDSIFAEARRLRRQVVQGADFIEVARAASDEPAAARGQVLAYQGHDDFEPAADSVVFDLRPGEVSPVIRTNEEMVFYRIESRRTPEFESVTDMIRRRLVGERRERRLASAADSLLRDARRAVADGAEGVVRMIAGSPDLAAGRVSGSLRLVRYDGGAFTVSELRLLLQARPDLKERFVEADDEELSSFLYQLAGDEVLIRAAAESGVDLSDDARENLRQAIAGQLSAIARRLEVSHMLVTNPAFDVKRESRRFIGQVLARAAPVPWLTEFRPVLDRRYPSRVDLRGAEAAARQARDLRGLGGDAVDDADAEHGGDQADTADHEESDETPESGDDPRGDRDPGTDSPADTAGESDDETT